MYHWSFLHVHLAIVKYLMLFFIICFVIQRRLSKDTCNVKVNVKVKWSRYRPGVAQNVGRGIALLFHDRGTRRGWVVSSTPRPQLTPGKDPVPIVQETGWAPGPVWKGGKSRPHRDSIPDRPARSSVAIPTELTGPRNVKVVVVFSYQCAWNVGLFPGLYTK